LIVILFSEIDTELPTPKFSTTVPATPALAILRVTLPVPALTCELNVIPMPVSNVTAVS